MPRARWALPWVAFLPFAVVGAIQLVTKVTDDHGLDAVTKSLCVPLLALAVLIVLVSRRVPVPPVVTTLLGAALLLSWLGDVLLRFDILTGLGAFLGAHLVFIALFALAFRRRISWWALLVLPWYAGLVVVLGPRLGAYLVPVLVYGAVLGGMAATATRGGALTTIGGILFVVSDSLLSFRLFTPWLHDDVTELLVMLTYLVALVLIVLGVMARLVAWPTPSSSGSEPDTSRTPKSRASRSRA